MIIKLVAFGWTGMEVATQHSATDQKRKVVQKHTWRRLTKASCTRRQDTAHQSRSVL